MSFLPLLLSAQSLALSSHALAPAPLRASMTSHRGCFGTASVPSDAEDEAAMMPWAATSPALTSARPYRAELRRRAIEGLTQLSDASRESLRHERAALFSLSERKLIVPVVVALLSLTHRRVGLRSAALVFLAARLATASLVSDPDPRQLIAWPSALRAGLRASTLSLEAAGLLALALLFGVSSACATAELGARALLSSAAELARHGAEHEVDWRASPVAMWSEVASGVRRASSGLRARLSELPPSSPNQTAGGAASEAASEAAAAADGASASLTSRGSAAERSVVGEPLEEALLDGTKNQQAEGAEAAAQLAVGGVGGATPPPSFTTPSARPAAIPSSPDAARSLHASSALRAKGRAGGGNAGGGGIAGGGGNAGGALVDSESVRGSSFAEGVVGAAAAGVERAAEADLRALARLAAVQSALQLLLAAAAAVWALETAFVLSLSLGQHTRLLLLATASAARRKWQSAAPATVGIVSSLPRSSQLASTAGPSRPSPLAPLAPQPLASQSLNLSPLSTSRPSRSLDLSTSQPLNLSTSRSLNLSTSRPSPLDSVGARVAGLCSSTEVA